MSDVTDDAGDALLALARAAVRRGEFTLASGRTSDFYFDGKQLTLAPEGSRLVAERLVDWLAEDRPVAVGGPTLGACPMVSAVGVVAAQRGLPLQLFYVRKEPKGHGTGSQIEGPPLPAGADVVMLEDTITTGGSLLRAVDAVRGAGFVVARAYCLLDREEGGRAALEAAGLELRALFTRSQLS